MMYACTQTDGHNKDNIRFSQVNAHKCSRILDMTNFQVIYHLLKTRLTLQSRMLNAASSSTALKSVGFFLFAL